MGDDEVVVLHGTVMVSIVTTVEMAVEVVFLLTGHRVTVLLCGQRVLCEAPAFHVSSMVFSPSNDSFQRVAYLHHDAAMALLYVLDIVQHPNCTPL